MGIDSLLKALKSVTKPRHISEYSNKKIAVDTYCWLHKGIFLCAQELSDGRETNEHINYCLKKVEQLKKYNITVVMVFDGAKLPSKKSTEEEREKKRNDNLQKHLEYKQQGEKDKAYVKLVESIDVTPQMASKLLEALRIRNIECIVAPYEADAQLAYLSLTEYVDVIITEDSDLIAYGARKVLYKLDKFGYGEEIDYDSIQTCTEYNFQNWHHQKFLTFCILSGCDYLGSISGIGIKRAYQVVATSQNYKQAIDNLQRKQKVSVPFDYVEQFEKAYLTFLFQRVFCPVQRKMVTVNTFDTDILYPQMKYLLEGNLDFLGSVYTDTLIQDIADGRICPQDLKPYFQSSKNLKQQSLDNKQQNENDKIEIPTFGNGKPIQVFKFIKKSQSTKINPEESFERSGESKIINNSQVINSKSTENNEKFQIENQQNYEQSNLFSSQQETLKQKSLINSNILANQNKKKSTKIIIKHEQKKINQYFQPSFKPFKPPSSLIQKQDQIVSEVNIIEEEIQKIDQQGISQVEEEFQQYSISEEYSDNFQKRFYYTDFGLFLNQELQFKQIQF
ncbi:unnamed protein product [Paramecium primaurelia]|uniref:Exonuclease 1 n=1 Tax=Paramecium primaurelia TaxID=5886 RepID=A0A8S1QJV1_PARPR|nr:unnamed protein product [Paramecium primaurelia]